MTQDFEPKHIVGYPTEETAEQMFGKREYQAATQFYAWDHSFLDSMGFEKGLAKMGDDQRSFYHWNKRIQPQRIMMTASAKVIYNWTRYHNLTKGPVLFEVPPRIPGHFYDMGMRACFDIWDVGPDKSRGGTA